MSSDKTQKVANIFN